MLKARMLLHFKNRRLLKTPQGSKFFSQIIKKYDVNTLAADLRRRAAWQFGNHGNGRLPLFSFSLLGLAMVNKPEQDDVISQTVRDMFTNQDFKVHSERNGNNTLSVNMLEFGKRIGKGCNAAVYEARMKNHANIPDSDNDIQIIEEETTDELPDQNSFVTNSSVLSASEQEDDDDDIVIISEDDSSISSEDSFDFVTDVLVQNILPAVEMVVEDAVFDSCDNTDQSSLTSSLSEDMKKSEKCACDLAVKMMFNYDIDSNTDAIMHAFRKETIPADQDVNADAPRYTMTLRDYLNKGDNTPPQLVISDFGCCLADINYGLKIPYQTNEIDRGGIPTLMAPEIACAVPGKDSWLDYNKADLWTVGTLVYELFGMENPFMEGDNKLDCRTYLDSQLLRLPEEVPEVVKLLTESMLKRDPKQRPSPEDAANLMQIYLWFPEILNSKMKHAKYEVINSLLILASKVLIGCHGDRLHTLVCLQWTFLKRFNLCDIKHLLNF
ncbi:hypothetical protein KUTeg_001392 [Tegillarca granosa]|uniref:non-specific serine/threonine protein kinase n=1 Tax=Tegillarca granosa TaxID=220873 RepID=A0ABQ9FRE1_TEGGR|nr:hypothetical protein KUTeg_001392 [Tegillarca granosa]